MNDELRRNQALKSDKSTIKNKPILELIEYRDNWVNQFSNIIEILKTTPEGVSLGVFKECYDKHIAVFNCGHNIQNWINVGLSIQGNYKRCPYCGQSIDDNKLIEAYSIINNEKFKEYEKQVNSLKVIADSIQYTKIIEKFSRNISRLMSYNSKNYFNIQENEINELQDVTDIIREEVEKYVKIFDSVKVDINEKIIDKQKDKYSKFIVELLGDFIKHYNNVLKVINIYNDTVGIINNKIKAEKEKLDDKILDSKINELNTRKTLLNQKVNKHMHSDIFDDIETLENSKNKITKEIKLLEEQFEKETSEYTNKYFDTLDKVYTSIGGRQFELFKAENSRTKTKSYSIGIRLKNSKDKSKKKDIDKNSIASRLSESDQRALAFAVFWSELLLISPQELEKTIVVLDDPITSFDDNRISKFICMCKEIEFRQLIILTHYKEFLQKMIGDEISIDKKEVKVYKINDINNEYKLQSVDKNNDTLLLEPLRGQILDVKRFVSGELDSLDINLRVIVETFIKTKYSAELNMKITDKNGYKDKMLSALMSELQSKKLIDDDKFEKLNSISGKLQNDNHSINNSNKKDKQDFAQEVLNLILTL